MSTFEVRFQMFGTATVDASNAKDAQQLVSHDLINWSGFGTDLEDVEVDGVDTEIDA
jgi:hypothetical protein